MTEQNREKNTTEVGAFILAAGEGRRLRPATLKTPKAAVPFFGVPLACLAAAKIAPLNVREIVLNTHYLPGQVEEAIKGLSDCHHGPMPPVVFSHEPTLLNTGGGLRQGCQLIPECSEIIAHNADVISDYPLPELLATHRLQKNLATLLLIPDRGPKTVSIHADGIILSFREPSANDHYTFSGIYIFNRRLLDYLPGTPAPSIVEAFENALTAGERIIGLPGASTQFWSDLGTPRSYIDTHRLASAWNWAGFPAMADALQEQRHRQKALLKNEIILSGSVAVGKNVAVAPGTRLHDCILWDDVKIPKAMELSTAIITQGTRVILPDQPVSLPSPAVFKTLGLAPGNCQITPLAEQGSGRRYARLSGSDPGLSWIWCAYTRDRPENAYSAACAAFMTRCGVNAPKTLLHTPETGELVFEDLGDVRLLDIDDPDQRLKFLIQVIEQIARLHSQSPTVFKQFPLPLQEPFGARLYTWERNYFREETLEAVFNASSLWTPAIEEECQAGQDLLIRSPRTIVHRDLQSANIMVKDGQAWFIDFQGMRLGVGVYDVASLIFDPYLGLSATHRGELWRHYLTCLHVAGAPAVTKEVLTAAAAQRLMQALGAYGKLWLKDGREWFKDHIDTGLMMLKQATAGQPAFSNLGALASTLLSK